MTLVEFLLARIGEDEAVARAAISPEEWEGTDAWGESMTEFYYGEHKWDPARVLAECESKRQIVEIHGPVDGDEADWYGGEGPADFACNRCGTAGEYGAVWPCGTIVALAVPYRDHPDYIAEWRP